MPESGSRRPRWNAPQYPPAEPDDLKNYEIGAKVSALDGRLSLDSAVFYIDWQGVQQTLVVPVTVTFLTSALVNAQSASGAGFEFGLTAEPIQGLTLSTNFSWNDLKVDEDTLSSGVVFYPKGVHLLYSAEYTAAASIDYAFPIGSAGF